MAHFLSRFEERKHKVCHNVEGTTLWGGETNCVHLPWVSFLHLHPPLPELGIFTSLYLQIEWCKNEKTFMLWPSDFEKENKYLANITSSTKIRVEDSERFFHKNVSSTNVPPLPQPPPPPTPPSPNPPLPQPPPPPTWKLTTVMISLHRILSH